MDHILSQLLLLPNSDPTVKDENQNVVFRPQKLLEGKYEEFLGENELYLSFKISQLPYETPAFEGVLKQIEDRIKEDFTNKSVDQLFETTLKLYYPFSFGLLSLFIQKNCTGPLLHKRTQEEITNPPERILCPAEKEALKTLELDGECIYSRMFDPFYLILARKVLKSLLQHFESLFSGGSSSETDKEKLSTLIISTSWWVFRCNSSLHQEFLSGPSYTLKTESNSLLERISELLQLPSLTILLPTSPKQFTDLFSTDITPTPESSSFFSTGSPLLTFLRTNYYLERALFHMKFAEADYSNQCFYRVLHLRQMSLQFDGVLGTRTRHQTFQTPLLVLRTISSASSKTSLTSPKSPPIEGAGVPKEVELDDESLLKEPRLDLNEADDQSTKGLTNNLTAFDQAIILALCDNMKHNTAADDLRREQMMTFVSRAQKSSENWLVYSHCLLQKSRLEQTNRKTAHRAALQVQALVDQFAEDDTEVNKRLPYFFSISYPPLWKLKKELGEQYLAIGAAASALQIFEELELWDHMIQCYMIMEKLKKGEEVVRQRLSVQPTPELWCILGDITSEVEHYKTAWELSKHHFARAQRSLGKHFLRSEKWTEASECFERSLAINPLYPNIWFSLGCAYMRLEKWVEGKNSFQRCVAQQTDEGQAWSNLAICCLQLKQREEAFKAFHEAVKYSRDNWKVWENYLYVSLDVGRPFQAIHAMNNLSDLLKERYTPPLKVLRALIGCYQKFVDLEEESSQESTPTDPKKRRESTQLFERLYGLFERLSARVSHPDVWEGYADFHHYVTEDLRREIDFRLKHNRAVQQQTGWESDKALFEQVAKAQMSLVRAYMRQGGPESLYSAKLSLRKIIKLSQDCFENTDLHQELRTLLQEVSAQQPIVILNPEFVAQYST